MEITSLNKTRVASLGTQQFVDYRPKQEESILSKLASLVRWLSLLFSIQQQLKTVHDKKTHDVFTQLFIIVIIYNTSHFFTVYQRALISLLVSDAHSAYKNRQRCSVRRKWKTSFVETSFMLALQFCVLLHKEKSVIWKLSKFDSDKSTHESRDTFSTWPLSSRPTHPH
jgi:hypothetical protein